MRQSRDGSGCAVPAGGAGGADAAGARARHGPRPRQSFRRTALQRIHLRTVRTVKLKMNILGSLVGRWAIFELWRWSICYGMYLY